MKLGFGEGKRSIHSATTVAKKRRTRQTIPTSNVKKTLNSQNPTNGTSHLDNSDKKIKLEQNQRNKLLFFQHSFPQKDSAGHFFD